MYICPRFNGILRCVGARDSFIWVANVATFLNGGRGSWPFIHSERISIK